MQDGKHVILCIDDDPDIRDSLQLILEGGGYQFIGAATAEEGVKLFKEQHPDLVIVDLMIEEVDSGTHLVKELMLLGGQVPIYLLSSVGDSLNLMASQAELGFTGILQKPVPPKTLLALLASQLGE